jgi:hypothetical protein
MLKALGSIPNTTEKTKKATLRKSVNNIPEIYGRKRLFTNSMKISHK